MKRGDTVKIMRGVHRGQEAEVHYPPFRSYDGKDRIEVKHPSAGLLNLAVSSVRAVER